MKDLLAITETKISPQVTGNTLFPVFIKLEKLRFLLIGGGAVGYEKLNTVLLNSPGTAITVIALQASAEVVLLCAKNHCTLILKPYVPSDLDNFDIVIAATANKDLASQIAADCRKRKILVNVADTPDLCDFYLGAIVKKGDLKIAISTNGKSPTLAKRIKELLNDVMPDSIQDTMDNLNRIRISLRGDFQTKVERLNEITSVMALETSAKPSLPAQKRKSQLTWLFAAAAVVLVLSLIVFNFEIVKKLGTGFYWMILTGFAAQIIAGALGMGYGVICTTVLMSLGISLPAISSSIHTAETFASGLAGFSHYKFKNVNKKLFRALLLPGICGAVAGAILLSQFGDRYAFYIRPVAACYTLFLGVKILLNAYSKTIVRSKLRRIPVLAAAGGFIDSFGGGGWGPLVTSSIIAKGKTPRFVVGSVSLAKFFVSAASALTFFTMLGIGHQWQIIAGLLLGGIAAAPLSARLAGIIPSRPMFISVGILVILCSLRLLFKSFY